MQEVSTQIVGQTHFGVHLTLDGYGGNFEKLNSKEIVQKCLTELPEQLGMHKIFGPEVLECGEANPKDSGGFSGFVMIAESHISCHTFPYRRFVSIDVYTCQNEMDKDYVIDYFTKAFELQDVEVNFIIRGKKYPQYDLIKAD